MYFEPEKPEVLEVGPSAEEIDHDHDGTSVGEAVGDVFRNYYETANDEDEEPDSENRQMNNSGEDNSEEDVETEENNYDKSKQSRRGRTTGSGRVTFRPAKLIDEMNGAELTFAEKNYYSILEDEEIACVGAGIGGGFENTSELKVMKYKEAMETDERENWKKSVEEEHERMKKYKVWEPIEEKNVPEDATVITSTWAMKKKSNGKYRAIETPENHPTTK